MTWRSSVSTLTPSATAASGFVYARRGGLAELTAGLQWELGTRAVPRAGLTRTTSGLLPGRVDRSGRGFV